MAALLNLEGGVILLGVEDDGTAAGLKRDPKKREEWVMEVARTHLRPGVIPFWETEEMRDGSVVGVISLPADAPDKPYKAKRDSAWVTQVRVGTTTRDATDDEEMRLYAQSRRLLYDHKPVPGATLENYDMRRLVNYFHDIRRQDCPDLTDTEGWTRFLLNLGLAHDDRGRTLPQRCGTAALRETPQPVPPPGRDQRGGFRRRAKRTTTSRRVRSSAVRSCRCSRLGKIRSAAPTRSSRARLRNRPR